jgi:alanine racemase
VTAGFARRAPIEARLVAAGLPPLPRTAWLEIDLDALSHNLDVLRRLAGSVSVRPVVKADAYGHGAVPVATALEGAGVDGFCVATFDEAIELRDGGIRGPLLVLYPIPAYLAQEAAHAGVSVTAGDPTLLADLVAATRDIATGEALEIELEVETGLGRGGFTGEHLIEAARLIEAEPALRLIGLWTHLQAVEDPDLTDRQLERFEATTKALSDASIAVPPRHVAASAAMLAGGIGLYDGIRPGLAIYGLVPDELDGVELPAGTGQALRPVMALYARPVRVETLPEGWGISYGPTFRTRRPSRIATLPIGYGDGWSRALSNRAEALVRGVRVPLVGNVAMDAVMADVTDVPGPPVGDADEFVLVGDAGTERISVGDLAHERNTNRWEVVTGMARRLPRVYHAAAGPVGLRALTERRI